MYISRSSWRFMRKTLFRPSTNPRQRLFPPQWLQTCLVSPMVLPSSLRDISAVRELFCTPLFDLRTVGRSPGEADGGGPEGGPPGGGDGGRGLRGDPPRPLRPALRGLTSLPACRRSPSPRR